MFSSEFCEISKNAFSTEHLWWLLLHFTDFIFDCRFQVSIMYILLATDLLLCFSGFGNYFLIYLHETYNHVTSFLFKAIGKFPLSFIVIYCNVEVSNRNHRKRLRQSALPNFYYQHYRLS